MSHTTDRSRAIWRFAAFGVVATTVAACGPADSPGEPTAVSASSTPTPSPTPFSTVAYLGEPSIELTFDDAPLGKLTPGTVVFDSSSLRNDALVVADGNNVPAAEIVGADLGTRAVQFPPPCASGEPCPRPILEVQDDPSLNPRTSDFEVGVVLQLDPDRTTTGSNVVQKGFAKGEGSQWKLQVDNVEGRPSCVIVGQGSSEILIVKSPLSIADGEWHVLKCVRESGTLSISVDGSTEQISVPPDLMLETKAPVRIGGRNTSESNDPFGGGLDLVWLSLAEEGA